MLSAPRWNPSPTVLTIAEVIADAPNNSVIARSCQSASPWQSSPNCPVSEPDALNYAVFARTALNDSPWQSSPNCPKSIPSPPLGEGRERGLHIVNHYSWTGLPFTVLLPKITEIAKAWGLRRLVADATGLGGPLCASLKQFLGHRFVSFVFTASSKSRLGYELLAAAGRGRLQIYAHDASADCDECWQELESAAADYKPNRILNFYVDPSKGHDDYLMSLALAVEAANRYEPRMAVGGTKA
ncbi:MAG: hypothetical protein TUN42_08755 [Dehalogenimonas sp.]